MGHLIKVYLVAYSLVVDGSACSKLSNTDSHLLGSIPISPERYKRMKAIIPFVADEKK